MFKQFRIFAIRWSNIYCSSNSKETRNSQSWTGHRTAVALFMDWRATNRPTVHHPKSKGSAVGTEGPANKNKQTGNIRERERERKSARAHLCSASPLQSVCVSVYLEVMWTRPLHTFVNLLCFFVFFVSLFQKRKVNQTIEELKEAAGDLGVTSTCRWVGRWVAIQGRLWVPGAATVWSPEKSHCKQAGSLRGRLVVMSRKLTAPAALVAIGFLDWCSWLSPSSFKGTQTILVNGLNLLEREEINPAGSDHPFSSVNGINWR